jgi:hypothetical protein
VDDKLSFSVNPVRNSSGELNPAGIILKSNPAAEQRGIISNGVNAWTNLVYPYHIKERGSRHGSGLRSYKACLRLQHAGIDNVKNIDGGMLCWCYDVMS